jgi:hypothetical protein
MNHTLEREESEENDEDERLERLQYLDSSRGMEMYMWVLFLIAVETH